MVGFHLWHEISCFLYSPTVQAAQFLRYCVAMSLIANIKFRQFAVLSQHSQVCSIDHCNLPSIGTWAWTTYLTLTFCSSVVYPLIYLSFRAVVSAIWALLSSWRSSAFYCLFYCIVSVLTNKHDWFIGCCWRCRWSSCDVHCWCSVVSISLQWWPTCPRSPFPPDFSSSRSFPTTPDRTPSGKYRRWDDRLDQC